MESVLHRSESPSLVIFGMPCRFTATVLQGLAQSGRHISAVITPQLWVKGVRILYRPATRQIPLIDTSEHPTVIPTLISLCQAHGIMLIEASPDELGSLTRRFRFLQSSLSIAACFPRKLPPELLDSLPVKPLNIHPSLLPRHRGPEPLFWTFHADDRVAGITIHQIDHEYDTGPIARAIEVPLAASERYQALELRLASTAVPAISALLHSYVDGGLELHPQSTRGATWARMPRPNDLIVYPDWPAERAYRFVHGVGDAFGPIRLQTSPTNNLIVKDALAFGTTRPPRNFSGNQSTTIAAFPDGWVKFHLAPEGG